MSTKIHHIPAIAGIRDLYTLLDVIKNKDKYTKVLNELEKARLEANDSFSKVGSAEQIDNLHKQSVVKYEQAKHALLTAQEKAEQITQEAGQKQKQIMVELDKKSVELDARTKEFNDRMNVIQSGLETRESEITKREQAAEKKETEARKAIQEANKSKEEYIEKLGRIRAMSSELT